MDPYPALEIIPRKEQSTGFGSRTVPLWLTVAALILVSAGYIVSQQRLESKVYAKSHCPVISRETVEKTLGLHKHVTEAVNGEVCSFTSEYAYQTLGVSRHEDTRGDLYKYISDGSSDPATVPSASAAMWVPNRHGLYFHVHDKLIVINGDEGVSQQDLLKLAAIIAARN